MTPQHHKISPLDLAWLFVESDATPMHVGSLLIFDASDFAPNKISALYDELIAQPAAAPPFNLRMHKRGLALPDWEDADDIDLEYHVQRWALPNPGNDEQLFALVAERHGEALDVSKPLWEFHLIEGLSNQRLAVYIKVHHSIMDGMAGLALMRSMMSDSAEAAAFAPWSAKGKIAELDVLHQARSKQHGLLNSMQQGFKELKQLPDIARSLRELAWAGMHQKHSDLQAAYTCPSSLINQRVSEKRHFQGLRLSLTEMRGIADHAGVTINDVLLSCCSGGLHRYLQDAGESSLGSLLAGLPFSLRKPGDVSMGSALSFLIANLASDETDPRERLAKVHSSTRAAKAHLHSLPEQALTEYTLILMAPYMGEILSGLAGHAPPAFNIIVSNVPGPRETLYFAGARLLQTYPLSIVTHGQGLNITVLGYTDQLHLGITACAKLPELTPLCAGIKSEFESLKNWAQ